MKEDWGNIPVPTQPSEIKVNKDSLIILINAKHIKFEQKNR